MRTTRTPAIICSCLAILLGLTAQAHAQWVQSSRANNIAYFLFGAGPRLERFCLTNSQWLAPISLPSVYGTPTAFAADADGLYVAYGLSVKRYDLNGGKETHLMSAQDPVQGIFTDGNLILLNHSVSLYARLTSLSKSNNAVIDQVENYINALGGASIARSRNKLFGRSMGISPADITYVTYQDDGTFAGGGDSRYHGDYPGAQRTWVFPGDTKVVDDAGIVYTTDDLTYVGSFGGTIRDLDFYGADVPVVLQGSRLTAFTRALLPTGSFDLPVEPKTIYVADTNVLAFTFDTGQTNGIRVDIVPLSQLHPPVPGQPIDPRGLAYTPDATFLDKNGVLYFLSSANQSLFRWDTSNQTYLATIPLVGSAHFAAYSDVNHKVYLAYRTGLIQQVDLNSTNLQETPFATLPSAPWGLATADSYVFAADDSGAWGTHYTFDPAGNLVSSEDWNYYSTEYIWSRARQKMYFFRDDTSPNDLLWEQINADGLSYTNLPAGGIGAYMDSPLHDSAGFTHPIRVSPDGTVVVLGSGAVHDATTLARFGYGLANSITDAAWVNGKLSTIRSVSSVAQLQQWSGFYYSPGAVRQFSGQAFRLLELGSNRLVAVCLQQGIPMSYVLDADFHIIAPPVLAAPADVAATILSTSNVNLSWDDVVGEETYTIERKTGSAGAWAQIGTAPTDSTNYLDSTVTTGVIYTYRVFACNGSQSSAASADVAAEMNVPPTPTNLAAVKLSHSAIQLSWDDVKNESAYCLQRQTGDSVIRETVAILPADTVTYTDADLSPNTRYTYRILATNRLGSSLPSSAASATTDAVLPTAPYFVEATAIGPQNVHLYWLSGSYADGYVIERRSNSLEAWSFLTHVGADVTSFNDTSVAPATTYAYRLYATNSLGTSGYSTVAYTTTPQLPAPPAAVPFVISSPCSSNAIAVFWIGSADASCYLLESKSALGAWTQIARVPREITYFTDTGLLAGTYYSYRVKVLNDEGVASDYSPVTTSQTLASDPADSSKISYSGSYNGLFFESDEVRLSSAGSFSLKISARATYSGLIQLQGRRYPISGCFKALQASNIIRRSGTNWLVLSLRAGSEGQIAGVLSDGDWTAILQADRAGSYSRAKPAPNAGLYTLVIPNETENASAPAGHSYGTIKVTQTGVMSFAGTLSDGTKISQSVPLSEQGNWPLYASLYSGHGLVMGALRFETGSGADVSGTVDWIKHADRKSRSYPNGFTNLCAAIGSAYAVPDASATVLGCANAQLDIAGGNLPSVSAAFAIKGNGQTVCRTSNRFSLRFSKATGAFTGSLHHPRTGRLLSFGGVVLQSSSSAYGFVLTGDSSSSVSLKSLEE
jgi:fibronectin type 3 domain-containing protein